MVSTQVEQYTAWKGNEEAELILLNDKKQLNNAHRKLLLLYLLLFAQRVL